MAHETSDFESPPLKTEPLKHQAFEVTRSFTDFWRSNTERLIAKYEERANEYDSRDLEMVGHSMATAHNQHGLTKTDKEIAGVLFYLQGKVARALSAMFRSKRPSADTCEDAFIYSMMLAYRQYLSEKEAKEVSFCVRDTDGDGNCQHCYKKGGCLAIGGPFR